MNHLQSLRTWWMSNSKAASRMLSRGSGTLLASRNMVMQDCKGTAVTRAAAVGRKPLPWSSGSLDRLGVPGRSNVTQWVWLSGDRRATSWPGSGTRCSAGPYAPAKFLHRQLGSTVKRVNLEVTGVKVSNEPRQEGSLTLQMTSKCLLLEKEPSCRQWSTSSCQRLHFTWKSVNVCAPPGWRKTAECLHVNNRNLCLNQLSDLRK